MSPRVVLLVNLALACYNVGTIWAHEVDIFRTWKLLDPATFRTVQAVHWKKLPYWVFAPVGLSLIGAVLLLVGSPGRVARMGHLGQPRVSVAGTHPHSGDVGTMAGGLEPGSGRAQRPVPCQDSAHALGPHRARQRVGRHPIRVGGAPAILSAADR